MKISFGSQHAFDDFLAPGGTKLKTAGRKKVASVTDLQGFLRVSHNQFVRKAERDLWQLEQDDDGQYFLARLVDADGGPVKV